MRGIGWVGRLRPRSWWKVSVRGLLVLIALIAYGLARETNRVRNQRVVAGHVGEYARRHEYFDNPDIGYAPRWEWAPEWLKDSLGEEYFLSIEMLALHGESADEPMPGEPMVVSDSVLDCVGKLDQLKDLSLGGCDLTDDRLGFLDGLSQLERLELVGSERVTDRGLAHVGRLGRLRSLTLAALTLSDEGFSRLRGLTELEELNLLHLGITGRGLSALEDCPIRLLTLDEMPSLSREGIGALTKWGGLESLTIEHCPQMTDEDVSSLAGLEGLKEVVIGPAPRLTDSGFASWRELKKLEQVDLWEVPITDRGFGYLLDIGNLKELAIIESRIRGDALCGFRGNRNLTWMYLAGNELIQDVPLDCLARKFPKLEWIDVSGCGLSEECKVRLRKATRTPVVWY